MVLRGISFQCGVRSLLILQLCLGWLMCPQRKSLASLMDFHSSESSFQSSDLEWSQSEFKETPCCEGSLTFGEALPCSPWLTGIAEVCAVHYWAIALCKKTCLSKSWTQIFLSQKRLQGRWVFVWVASNFVSLLNSCLWLEGDSLKIIGMCLLW